MSDLADRGMQHPEAVGLELHLPRHSRLSHTKTMKSLGVRPEKQELDYITYILWLLWS